MNTLPKQNNIEIYVLFLKQPLSDDVKAVFTQKNASQNHLEALIVDIYYLS